MALTDFLSGIADAIRTKDGTNELIPATDFTQRILDIPSGGSVNLSCGTFITTEETNTVTVEHGLSVIPNFGIVFIFDDTSGISVSNIFTVDLPQSNAYKHYEIRSYWGNIQVADKSSEQQFVYSDTEITFNLLAHPFWAGKKHMWICGRIEVNE